MLFKEIKKTLTENKSCNKNIIIDIFDSQGLIVDKEDVTLNNEKEDIESMIKDAYINKKLYQFLQYPNIPDLKESIEIIPAVIQIMKLKDHPVRAQLMKESPKMTADQIIWYMESIYRKGNKVSHWKRKCLIMFIIAAVVVFIGYIIYIYTDHQEITE